MKNRIFTPLSLNNDLMARCIAGRQKMAKAEVSDLDYDARNQARHESVDFDWDSYNTVFGSAGDYPACDF